MLYDEEIQNLQNELEELEEQRLELEAKLEAAQDPVVWKTLKALMSSVIDAYDKGTVELERLENLRKGSSNGHDKHFDESHDKGKTGTDDVNKDMSDN